MGKKKKRAFFIVTVMVLIISSVFLYVQSRPFSVVYSSVFSTAEQTEIQLYVLMNTFLNVDEEELTERIITEHQKINGVRKDTVYTLSLYRTLFHYRRNWEYDTIVCDENGAIICCGADLGV